VQPFISGGPQELPVGRAEGNAHREAALEAKGRCQVNRIETPQRVPLDQVLGQGENLIGEGDPIMVGLARVPPGMAPSIAPGGGGNKFRAFDKATGRVLWETELPAGTTGAPMTYLFQGKQYIVIAVGGREHPGELVALTLP